MCIRTPASGADAPATQTSSAALAAIESKTGYVGKLAPAVAGEMLTSTQVGAVLGAQAAGAGVGYSRWLSNAGGWLDLKLKDINGEVGDTNSIWVSMSIQCDVCARQAQWVAGDFDGDGTTDLAHVFSTNGWGGSSTPFGPAPGGYGGNINIDLYLDRHWAGSDTFMRVTPPGGHGGWVSPCSWVAQDMDADGRADLVNVFLDPASNADNIDADISNLAYTNGALTSSTTSLTRCANLPACAGRLGSVIAVRSDYSNYANGDTGAASGYGDVWGTVLQ